MPLTKVNALILFLISFLFHPWKDLRLSLPIRLGKGTRTMPAKPFSYFISVFPSADSFSAVGLPAGIDLNSTTGEISGVPLQGGSYQITVTASNSFGDSQQIVSLKISEVDSFSHSIEMSLSGYTGTETLHNFPMLVRMNQLMDANFSVNNFASDQCNDLRFYDEKGRDLPYEIETIDFEQNTVIVWVRVAELNSDKSIFAYWGNPQLADTAPIVLHGWFNLECRISWRMASVPYGYNGYPY